MQCSAGGIFQSMNWLFDHKLTLTSAVYWAMDHVMLQKQYDASCVGYLGYDLMLRMSC